MGDMADMLFDEAMMEEMEYEDEMRAEDALNHGFWPSQEGDTRIKDMTDLHIENAIAWMKRNPDAIITQVGGIDRLRIEQKRRRNL